VKKLLIVSIAGVLVLYLLTTVFFGGLLPGAANNIVNAAVTLENHIYGYWSNQYNPNDSALTGVINYWKQACGNGVSLCPQATSGSLQCVMFVVGAFAMAGDPLPIWGNANQFWGLFANRTGWQEIPSGVAPPSQRGLPAPGDIVAWTGGLYGHIAIVVRVIAPSPGKDGSLTVAQANAPGTLYSGSTQAGNLYTMTLSGNPSTYLQAITWPGYMVQGYIRQIGNVPQASSGAFPLTADQPAGLPSGLPRSPWVTVAWNDAIAYHIPPQFFVKQINVESRFNPNAISPAGAVGIAQFLPSTAAGIGVDPWNADDALKGAAYEMESSFLGYLGNDRTAQGVQTAYSKALAAYNAGAGNAAKGTGVAGAVAQCGARWLSCMPAETQQYVQSIMAN
jgi:soluble lytic murein transglycosylase-like protein